MARLAILGLLSFVLLVLKVSAQSTDYDPTMVDDSDYDAINSGLQPDHIGVWMEPIIPPDPKWKDRLCQQYRNGAI